MPRRPIAVTMCALLGATACSEPTSDDGDPSTGQESIQAIVFDDDERAWINREPDPTANIVGVYHQPAGGAQEVVEIEHGTYFGLLLTEEGLYFTNGISLLLWAEGSLSVRAETNGLPTAPVIDGERVYLASTSFTADPDGTLHHLIQAYPRAGGDGIMLYDRADQVLDLLVDDTTLYWVEMGQPDGAMSLWSAAKDGSGTPEQLDDLGTEIQVGPILYQSSDRIFYFYSEASWAFSEASIDTLPKDGSAPTETFYAGHFVGAGIVFAFEPEPPRLFGIAPEAPNDIVEFPLEGGTPSAVATCHDYCNSVAARSGEVMWSDATGIHPDF